MKKGFEYSYYIKDHLGSTRVVLSQTGKTLQQNSYYPFGMLMAGIPLSDDQNAVKYLYNGKELQDDFGLNWYDYGARFYDAGLGRFTEVDPVADTFAFVSTYNYAENSPIANIDLWGMQAVPFQGLMAFGNPEGYSKMVDRQNETLKNTDVQITLTAGAQIGGILEKNGALINIVSIDIASVSSEKGFAYLGKNNSGHVSIGGDILMLSGEYSFDTKDGMYGSKNEKFNINIGGLSADIQDNGKEVTIEPKVEFSAKVAFLIGIEVSISCNIEQTKQKQ